MAVFAQEQRAVDAIGRAVLTRGLSDGENVGFVERTKQSSPAMTAGAEGHALTGVTGVGCVEVRSFERADVDEKGTWREFAC